MGVSCLTVVYFMGRYCINPLDREIIPHKLRSGPTKPKSLAEKVFRTGKLHQSSKCRL